MRKLQHSSYGGRTIGTEYLLEVVGHVVRCHAAVTENEAVRMLLSHLNFTNDGQLYKRALALSFLQHFEWQLIIKRFGYLKKCKIVSTQSP